MVVSLLRIRKLINFHHVGKLNVIHVVYVATRSLFAQFVIYNFLLCINMINMCCVICTCIYMYIHIFDSSIIWIISVLWTVFCPCVCTLMNCCPHYFAEVWTTDIICTCIKLDELHIYLYIYVYIYIVFWSSFALRKYMFMFFQPRWNSKVFIICY